jgi:hypothetical protein
MLSVMFLNRECVSMMDLSLKVAISITLMSLVSGCATPYQAFGFGGGYKETKISENRFQLHFSGNGPTSFETVQTYWHRRAKELCNGDYDYEFTNTDNVKGSSLILAGTMEFPRIDGIVTCKKQFDENET